LLNWSQDLQQVLLVTLAESSTFKACYAVKLAAEVIENPPQSQV